MTIDATRLSPDASPQAVASSSPPPGEQQDSPNSVRVEGPYRRTFSPDGSLLYQDFYHLGRPALRCTPTTSSGEELRCVLSYPHSGGLALDPSCWKGARLPSPGAQGISSRAAFERIFRCTTRPQIDWVHARLVLVQTRVANSEKLEVLVFQRQSATELVAQIGRRCYGVRLPDHEQVVDRRELHLVPREGKLSARVERNIAGCGPVP